jgi:hypothetical protein
MIDGGVTVLLKEDKANFSMRSGRMGCRSARQRFGGINGEAPYRIIRSSALREPGMERSLSARGRAPDATFQAIS